MDQEAINLLSRALEHLYWVQDEGPPDEGWKSPELMALIKDIEAKIAVGPTFTTVDSQPAGSS